MNVQFKKSEKEDSEWYIAFNNQNLFISLYLTTDDAKSLAKQLKKEGF